MLRNYFISIAMTHNIFCDREKTLPPCLYFALSQDWNFCAQLNYRAIIECTLCPQQVGGGPSPGPNPLREALEAIRTLAEDGDFSDHEAEEQREFEEMEGRLFRAEPAEATAASSANSASREPSKEPSPSPRRGASAERESPGRGISLKDR